MHVSTTCSPCFLTVSFSLGSTIVVPISSLSASTWVARFSEDSFVSSSVLCAGELTKDGIEFVITDTSSSVPSWTLHPFTPLSMLISSSVMQLSISVLRGVLGSLASSYIISSMALAHSSRVCPMASATSPLPAASFENEDSFSTTEGTSFLRSSIPIFSNSSFEESSKISGSVTSSVSSSTAGALCSCSTEGALAESPTGVSPWTLVDSFSTEGALCSFVSQAASIAPIAGKGWRALMSRRLRLIASLSAASISEGLGPAANLLWL
mmetsp:Transcript_2795/g.4090  ORF Transcript_2795/g.4090 Transcript_2795/m.4090 type:complete len:267 (+) Transcript_2795:648-1448(+)